MTDKIYCGNGKEHHFQNGSVLNIMLDMTTLEQYFQQYGFTSNAGNKKMKIKVSSRREVDQYGNTHSVIIDTWKPDNGGNTSTPTAPQQTNNSNDFRSFENDSIPF